MTNTRGRNRRLLLEPKHMWQAAGAAPPDQDLEVAVIDGDGAHPVVFPCRRVADGWIAAATRRRLDIRPTHWRPWVWIDRSSAR